MFAVIKTGGTQYKVAAGDRITVERLPGDAGASIALDQVLALGSGSDMTIGSPMISGAVVTAEVVEQTRGDKIIVFKKKRRQNYRRKNGHRQDLTVLKITDIAASGQAKTEATSAEPAPAKKPRAKKAAAKTEE
jgi:large subunit ribosomal protein L21